MNWDIGSWWDNTHRLILPNFWGNLRIRLMSTEHQKDTPDYCCWLWHYTNLGRLVCWYFRIEAILWTYMLCCCRRIGMLYMGCPRHTCCLSRMWLFVQQKNIRCSYHYCLRLRIPCYSLSMVSQEMWQHNVSMCRCYCVDHRFPNIGMRPMIEHQRLYYNRADTCFRV